MANNKEEILCYTCEDKPAKRIKSDALCASQEKIFCSVRCAADAALIRANDAGLHWKKEQKRWSDT